MNIPIRPYGPEVRRVVFEGRGGVRYEKGVGPMRRLTQNGCPQSTRSNNVLQDLAGPAIITGELTFSVGSVRKGQK